MTSDTQQSDEIGYKFRGIPLTPTLIAELLPRLMRSEVFRRAEAIDSVTSYHEENGGAPTTSNPIGATKKALSMLSSEGLVEGTGAYGLWRWRNWTPMTEDEAKEATAKELREEELDVSQTLPITFDGEGSGSVYVYYFNTYRELAEARGEDIWPIKVGMSLLNFRARIDEQQGTAMPEPPVISYVRRTNIPRKMERLVHSVLSMRGLQIEEAPGAEWFLTSPSTVQEIIHWALAEEPDTDHLPIG